MFEMRIIIQLLALLLFSTTVYAQINPSNRVTAWQPGVTHDGISNGAGGGIPNRTTIYKQFRLVAATTRLPSKRR
jgi:hypothetical protein